MWSTEFSRESSKYETQMAEKCLKKCSTPLAIREIQMKSTLIFHLILVTMEINQKLTAYACDNTGKVKTYSLMVGVKTCTACYGNQCSVSLRIQELIYFKNQLCHSCACTHMTLEPTTDVLTLPWSLVIHSKQLEVRNSLVAQQWING